MKQRKTFEGVGAFDHLEWTYDGAFEQLFGLGRGNLNENFPKIQMPGGFPGGMFKLRFDLYITIIKSTTDFKISDKNLHFLSPLLIGHRLLE